MARYTLGLEALYVQMWQRHCDGLPPRALGWSLVSFNVGVEIGQLGVVLIVASALAALRARHEAAGRRLVFAGSVGVMAAGAFWFVQRVFFAGGMS